MKRWIWAVLAWVLVAVPAVSPAAHTRASLLLSAAEARPGETVLAGVRLQMDEGWHTYWKNPGESGKATEILWELPPGVSAGEIQWPVPEKHVAEGLTTYVYHHEVVLLVPLTLPADAPPGPLRIGARVNWLECQTLCLPGRAQVSAELRVGPDSRPSNDGALLESWRARLPEAGERLNPRAWWDGPASESTRAFVLEFDVPTGVSEADLFPDPAERFEVRPEVEALKSAAGRMRLRKSVKRFEGEWPERISGVLVWREGATHKGFAVDVPVEASPPAERGAGQQVVDSGRGPSLALMLVYAFLGGLILNVMPCVLPVIALKILGFVNQAREEPRRVRQLGLIYALGVLVSFLALAGVVIAVKAAGQKAGWGMQFSSPTFVVGMTVLVTVVALNLFGVFEVTLGGRAMDAAGALASKHGAAGSFFNGVLATALATPCTAPFLSVALGFAFTQPAPIIVLMFLAVGAGLASPYVVLSWQPQWLKFLPKPGDWMQRFKVFMGFPMLATAVWLTSLTTEHYGERAWWLGMFLVFLALAAWVFGTFVQRGTRRRGVGATAALLLLATGYLWALESQLRWREPVAGTGATPGSLRLAPAGYGWQPWSATAVERARVEGRVVIVDFTAKWCITCNALVKPALEKPSVVEELRRLNAVALLADYTGFAPDITDELARFGRAGVPLVVVYPKRADAAPLVLPDPNPVLGPGHYAGLIVEALQKAGQ
ncbi:MAG: protein-disulfide reductase DsbD family protein [Verrucomicrobiae bacterium]|nr:protein-disulfide reductase DsbD family protein [Verrucomicrobiae bacterium]